jgi:hypothetical protein
MKRVDAKRGNKASVRPGEILNGVDRRRQKTEILGMIHEAAETKGKVTQLWRPKSFKIGFPMKLLKQIETLFHAGTAGALTDGQLLERFLQRRDDTAEAAFAALVDRHGTMVLRVCRQVVGDEHDAEDAAQATFLVLARRAGSISRRESVASWLYGVALRVAARGVWLPPGDGRASAEGEK